MQYINKDGEREREREKQKQMTMSHNHQSSHRSAIRETKNKKTMKKKRDPVILIQKPIILSSTYLVIKPATKQN